MPSPTSDWLAWIVLLIAALSFVVLGVLGLWRPEHLLEPFDLPARTTTARQEIRAMYGGLMFSFAAIIFWGMGSSHARLFALVLLAVSLLGLLLGRGINLALEGRPSSLAIGIALFEFVMLALSGLALFLLERPSTGSPG
ncbi:hypothetical protein Pan216_38950 [Planctomycetes bacterium Pan216]|uniref:DUF4345 domain-containing protein n=1 Tax=Kolteria novifilia TaxID=2527975 RepID=A0A518B7S8_9BACT|nr:hypothetical protein Pan216_38950 [Planctomycetes bacterium Pan216]